MSGSSENERRLYGGVITWSETKHMMPANLSSFVRGARLSDLVVLDRLNLRIVRVKCQKPAEPINRPRNSFVRPPQLNLRLPLFKPDLRLVTLQQRAT